MIESDIAVGAGLRITCSKDELVQGLTLVGRAVSSRTAIQILAGILLEAHDGELRLAATDMELSLRATVPARVEGDGAIVLPGRTLVDIARLLPGDDVMIEHRAAESVVHVSSGSASYTLNTYNAEDFPRLPELTAAETFTVDRDALLETIARVARAASRDEARPVLTGVLVQFAGDKLVMAATDSYRLAVKETALSSTAPELEAIVPSRALQELVRIPVDGDEVAVGVQENQVLFSAGGVWLTTRRIDGQFPNYRQLLPETFEHELTISRSELLDVVRRAAVMIQRATPLQLRFADGEVTVVARTHEVGESKESMPVAYGGEPLEIGFNAEFLKEGLESVEGDDVKMKLISSLRPAILTDEADDFTYLVMPIRLPRLIVDTVSLRDFRSYERLELGLQPGLVLVVGANGVGKTNLLEGVHVATQGFSPRTRTDSQVVRFGAEGARAAVSGRRGEVLLELEVAVRRGEGKRARLNGAPLRAAEQLRGLTSTLVFTPDRLGVVKGPPAARRAYFDRVLGRLAPARATLSPEYGAAVAQRNAALRRAAMGASGRDAIEPWSERVATLGAELVAARLEVLALLEPAFGARADEFGLGAVSLRYDGEPPTAEALAAALDRDLDRGATSLGPHLDDVVISAAARDLRSFGSQGEQRLALLALLLAESEMIADRTGVPPLLLLDDVLSELDPGRRRILADRVRSAGQALVTATDAAMLPAAPDQLLEVTPGTVLEAVA